jgi:hypothetical protein
MKILDNIGVIYNTDKSSVFHDYLKKYEKYLPFYRNEKLKILEIGVYRGASLKTWSEYYYNSIVVGIDIDEGCKSHEQNNIFVEIGNQTDIPFLTKVSNMYGPFDIIIDDGSHINEDVLKSFHVLFPQLNSKGVYIIEDTCCSYWSEFGGDIKNPNSVVNTFKSIIDEVNFFGKQIPNNIHCRSDQQLLNIYKDEVEKYIGYQIESLTFSNSMIILNKR